VFVQALLEPRILARNLRECHCLPDAEETSKLFVIKDRVRAKEVVVVNSYLADWHVVSYVELDLVSDNIMSDTGKLGRQTELAHHDLHDSNNKNQSDYVGGWWCHFREVAAAKTGLQW
jgi:hypothetical protein